jgi:site-specific recombinase XerD
MITQESLTLIVKTLAKIDGAYAPNTLRAYRVDMMEFHEYCCTHSASALPALPEVIASFVLKVSTDGVKSSTIRRKVSSISALHRLSGLADPTKSPDAALAVRKMHRQLGRHSKQAQAVNLPNLEQFLVASGDELRGFRDKALLLLGYDTLRRRSELVNLLVEDLEFKDDGTGTVLLRKNKTDQDGTGRHLHLSLRTCTALREWFHQTGIIDGYILRGVSPGNKVTNSLGEGQISRIYKRIATDAGLDVKSIINISGHSLRVGGAQDMCKSGASLPQIMVKGGWTKPDTVMRYIEKTIVPSPQL